jgi:hypothetical protein
LAFSAFWRTVAAISSVEAAVSSRLDAACSVRRERSSAPGADLGGGVLDLAGGPGELADQRAELGQAPIEGETKLLELAGIFGVDGGSEITLREALQAGGERRHRRLPLGDVGRELHDLLGLAFGIEDRVVGRLDPDALAALGDPLVLVGEKLTASERRPESLVVRARGVIRLDEDPVMLALDLVQAIAHRVQKILVRGEDLAVQGEFDHGIGAGHRGNLARRIRGAELLRGDVGREFHHPDRLAFLIEDRVVGGLNPDGFAALGDPLEFRGLVKAVAQVLPEGGIGGARRLRRIDELAVMLADDLRQGVAHCLEKIVVGAQHVAVEIEGDHRHRTLDRVDPADGVVVALLLLALEQASQYHHAAPNQNSRVKISAKKVNFWFL